MRLSQHKLCTWKMELALAVKFYLDFHWITRPWRRTLTNGSDVKYVFSRCHPTPCGDREYSATISTDVHMSTTTTAFQGTGPNGGPGASVTDPVVTERSFEIARAWGGAHARETTRATPCATPRPVQVRSHKHHRAQRGSIGCFPLCRTWRIVLLKVAYYATSSARNFAKLCQNYARIPKLCSWFPKLCSHNDVDSVHLGAR